MITYILASSLYTQLFWTQSHYEDKWIINNENVHLALQLLAS